MLGSHHNEYVNFYSVGNHAGGVTFYFYSTPQYLLSWCDIDKTDFPTTLPSANDKVWRITLIKTAGIRVVIHCNDVEVLNILFSDTTCSDSRWREYWTRDVASVVFVPGDTASDYYRAGK